MPDDSVLPRHANAATVDPAARLFLAQDRRPARLEAAPGTPVIERAVAALAPGDFLTRTYRVSAASRPLMVITERFPWGFRE